MYKIITHDYYKKHAQDFEDLGYSKVDISFMPTSINEQTCRDLHAQGFDTVTVFKGKKAVLNLGKKINPFDENCKIWMPPKEEK